MANDSIKDLQIVCYNMHGFHQGLSVVTDLIDSHKPHVFLLQEHWLTPSNLSLFDKHFTDYFTFGSSAMSKSVEAGMLRGRPFGGVAMLIKNDLRRFTETVYCEERFVVVRVANYLIINVYLPCVGSSDRAIICEDILQAVSAWRDRYIDCEIIIGGDFNVNLDRPTDNVAMMVRNFASDLHLYRCDDLFQSQKTSTYVNLALGQESQIDFVMVSRSNDVNTFQVLDPDVNFSDHLPLVVDVAVAPPAVNTKVSPKGERHTQKQLRWDKAALADYYNYTGVTLSPVLSRLDELLIKFSDSNNEVCDCSNHIEVAYNDVVNLLNVSAAAFVPQRCKNFFKFWWNEELKLLKEESVNSNRIWKAAGKPRNGPLYQKRQSCRLQYRRRLKEDRNSETRVYTNELHDALLKKNNNDFWKCWRSKFDQSKKCIEVEGCVDVGVVADKFGKYFSGIYSCNNPVRAEVLKQEFLSLRENYCGLPLSDDMSFDTELVSQVVGNLKRGKAPGMDGLMAEHLMFSHPILPVILSKLFQLILLTHYVPTGFKYSYLVPIPKPKDYRSKALSCDDFRGIAISPIISKVFEYCLLERCQPLLRSSDKQFGFKKGQGCSHAVHTVRNIVDKFVNKGSTVNLCAIDVSKAFDKVNHYALYTKLMKRNIPVLLLDLIINLFSGCSLCIKWQNIYSEYFGIEFGVRQGSVLSPILFAVYIDDICDCISLARGCSIVLYADDVLLISPSVVDLERLLHICERELENLDMVINTKKSCCLRIGPRHDVVCANIVSLNGSVISWTSELRYLGVYIVSSRVFKCSLQHAKHSFYRGANAIFGKLGRIASEEVVLHLIERKCLPLLLFGLEVCPLTKTELRSLDFCINRFFMKLFKTSDMNIVEMCQVNFSFRLPSDILHDRTKKFLDKITIGN